MKKLISYLAVLILVFFGLFVYQQAIQVINRQEVKQNTEININQSIYDDKNQERFLDYKVKVGATALDLLKKTAEIKIKGEGVNAYVISINGKEAKSDNKEYWAFYVNGKPAEVGAGSYILKSKDKVEWKIEKY